MKKYLITGGAGFIGSHIAEELSKKGNHVTVLDNLRTGFQKNLEGLDVEFVNGGDIKHSTADPSRFQQLGFKPLYSLDKALSETIEYYDKLKGKN